ncbi:E3 ubiquitin-protein ligase RNF34-like [Apostichopus japonicus]|uniref:E3 ubiquitin-protein ligase RNF34-like n=1 Tax=Stichopus japonicus TaxID=307972 RepID=UPI003AB19B99
MGSSPSSQPGANFQNHSTHPSHRASNNLSSRQSQAFVAWSSQAHLGSEETSTTTSTPAEGRNNDTMVCEACKANFNLLRRKNLCCDCKKQYCSSCSAKEHRRCHNCLLFKCPITRDKLHELKMKDLRQYLSVHDIPTERCKEKGDLVELIYNFLNSRSTNGPTGLYQGSANISQNRSGSGSGFVRAPPLPPNHPPSGPQTGFTNLQNTAERLYSQAHQQFFGGSAGATEGRPFGSVTVTTDFGRNHPHGPFATSQEQYSSSAAREQHPQHSSQESRPTPTPAAARSNTNTTTSGDQGQDQTEETSNQNNEATDQNNQGDAAEQTSEPPPKVKRRASLKDIVKPEDIEQLSVRQLKEILRANFVDYKGCVERYELLDRVKRLYDDREEMKAKEEKAATAPDGEPANLTSTEDDLCRICMDATIDCVLLECGHMVTCTTCGKQMNECPICRQYVIRCVHIFRS